MTGTTAGLLVGLLAIGLAGCGSGPPGGSRPSVTPAIGAAPRSPASRTPASAWPSAHTPTATSYVFPLRPARAGRFGRVHHDYPATDIFAPCGTAVVSVVNGVVDQVTRTDTWSVRRDDGATRGGLSVSIIGADGVRYYGSHLRSLQKGIAPGRRVSAGDELGRVGHTGSARPTACHLHFGISPPACVAGDWWNRRGVLSPYPYLTSWRGRGEKSPAGAVTAWKHRHGCPGTPPRA